MSGGVGVGTNNGRSDDRYRWTEVETDFGDFGEITLSIRSLSLPKFNSLISYIPFWNAWRWSWDGLMWAQKNVCLLWACRSARLLPGPLKAEGVACLGQHQRLRMNPIYKEVPYQKSGQDTICCWNPGSVCMHKITRPLWLVQSERHTNVVLALKIRVPAHRSQQD